MTPVSGAGSGSSRTVPENWDELQAEVGRLDADPNYQGLRRVLESVQSIVGSKSGNIDSARQLLEAVKRLQGEVTSGRFNQPGWNVETVIQAAQLNLNMEPLRELIEKTLDELRPKEAAIPVPVVLVVMTATEAADLESGAAFAHDPASLQAEFARLQTYLVKVGLNDWPKHYGPRSEDWHPFDGDEVGPTIEQQITQALRIVIDRESLKKPLVPRFHNLRSLNEPNQRGALIRLRRDGCVVIVDTVSLRHPRLLRAFQQTLLDAFPSASVLTLAPRGDARKLMESMTHALELTFKESEFRQRIDDPDENACCELAAMDMFPKWFLSRVRQICGQALVQAGALSHINRV